MFILSGHYTMHCPTCHLSSHGFSALLMVPFGTVKIPTHKRYRDGSDKICLLYTSDAADEMQCVDLGCRRIIKKCRGG